MFSISLFISIFPRTGFMAFEPVFKPRLARELTRPLPIWPIPRDILYFFLILLALSCVGVFARANLTFFCFGLARRLFLGPIVRVLDTVIFPSRFFLLIFLYLDTKVVPLGRVTLFGTALRPRTILFLLAPFSYDYHHNFF